MKAFFKLIDHRRDRVSVLVRLSEIVGVSDPQSDRHDWTVVVHLRSGVTFTMSGDINAIYRQRDELMHALEQDATRDEPPAVTGSGYDGAMGDLAAG